MGFRLAYHTLLDALQNEGPFLPPMTPVSRLEPFAIEMSPFAIEMNPEEIHPAFLEALGRIGERFEKKRERIGKSLVGYLRRAGRSGKCHHCVLHIGAMRALHAVGAQDPEIKTEFGDYCFEMDCEECGKMAQNLLI